MYKMIVTDLDGTLLNKNKNVSEKSKKYLKELKDKGYIICVDTGRTLGRAKYALGGFDYINYIIGNNGTYIYDVSNDRSLYKSSIKTEKIKALFIKYLDEYEVFEINSYENILSYRSRTRNIEPYVEKIDNKDEFFDKINEVYNVTISLKNKSMVNVFLEDLKNNYKDIGSFIMEDSFSNKKWITLINQNDNKNIVICWLGNTKKVSKYLTLNDKLYEHIIFIDMHVLDNCINDNMPNFWDTFLYKLINIKDLK